METAHATTKASEISCNRSFTYLNIKKTQLEGRRGRFKKNPITNKLPGSSDELAAEVNSGVDSPGSTRSNSSASSLAC